MLEVLRAIAGEQFGFVFWIYTSNAVLFSMLAAYFCLDSYFSRSLMPLLIVGPLICIATVAGALALFQVICTSIPACADFLIVTRSGWFFLAVSTFAFSLVGLFVRFTQGRRLVIIR